MAIATSFKDYLDKQQIRYETVTHPHSSTAMETALAAGIPMTRLTKSVVFRDENQHYLMAVLPSQCRAEIDKLNALTNHQLTLVDENELADLFRDCELGAIPPAGNAYSMTTVWDDKLNGEEEIYVEAGDHEHLLHLSREGFTKLMGRNPHGSFSRPIIDSSAW